MSFLHQQWALFGTIVVAYNVLTFSFKEVGRSKLGQLGKSESDTSKLSVFSPIMSSRCPCYKTYFPLH